MNSPGDPQEAEGQVLAPETIIDRKYEVLRLLGKGGFGTVYLVQNSMRWQFALKLLRPECGSDDRFRKRFLEEMELARDLLHPNAAPVHDAGMAREGLYYVMSYIPGRTVADIIQKEGPLDPWRVTGWGIQVLSFLEYLHAMDYIHRDIKPANLLIRPDGAGEKVHVLDLGIAKSLAAQHTSARTAGINLGSPPFMAPEQFSEGTIEVDRRVDIYALGVTLYECASGKRPFDAPTISALIHAILSDDPLPISERVPGFPAHLEKIIHRAMEKDREKRFGSARDFSMALEEARRTSRTKTMFVSQQDIAGVSGAPRVAEIFGKPSRRRPLFLFLAFLLLGSLALGIWAVIGRTGASPLVEIQAPRDGRKVSGPSIEIQASVRGNGPFRAYLQGREVPVREGAIREILPLDREGTMEVSIRFQDARGKEAEKRLVLHVDNRPPVMVRLDPPSGMEVAGPDARVTVVADEDLGEGTSIGGQAAEVKGRTAGRILTLAEGPAADIPIVLVDLAGNKTLIPEYRLQGPPLPRISVLEPIPGSRVRGPRVKVVLSAVSRTEPMRVTVEGQEASRGEDGFLMAEVPMEREGEVTEEASLLIRASRKDRVVLEMSLPLVIDTRAPRMIDFSPEQGWQVMEAPVLVTITADEDLGEGTAIGGSPAAIDGAMARASITLAPGENRLAILLRDKVGNLRTEEYSISREAALGRIPAGMEAVSGKTRKDPSGSGWATPVRESRTGIELVLVPATTPEGFLMGAVPEDRFANDDEKPRHKVRLTRPFYLGRAEVTWEQWERALNLKAPIPLLNRPDFWRGSPQVSKEHPVVTVGWKEAVAFCDWLGMRLPSESEWEWACRCEAPDAVYPWGNDFEGAVGWANVLDASRNEIFPTASRDLRARGSDGCVNTAPVASFRASATLGLQDMIGNVLEWCLDAYSEKYEQDDRGKAIEDPVRKPERPGPCSRVLRGGSFKAGAKDARISRRWKVPAEGEKPGDQPPRYDDIGFRVCFDPSR